jgi:hypothetical protein
VARTDALAHELEDVITDFHKLTDKELASINEGLKKKGMEAISVMTEADWQKQHQDAGSGSSASGLMREMD